MKAIKVASSGSLCWGEVIGIPDLSTHLETLQGVSAC